MRNNLLNIDLNERRQILGMSCRDLAERSGVPMPTVQRIMYGDMERATMSNVVSVAEALGVEVALEPTVDSAEYRKRQAEKKARQLVGMAQGSSALEAQAVDSEVFQEMVEEVMHTLLNSKRKLWAA